MAWISFKILMNRDGNLFTNPCTIERKKQIIFLIVLSFDTKINFLGLCGYQKTTSGLLVKIKGLAQSWFENIKKAFLPQVQNFF